MPLPKLLHITVAYSHAVLVAILPYISDFAKKLDLPIPQPITTNQVARFNPSNLKGFIGGGLWLTNHYLFNYNNGCVESFRCLDDNPFFDNSDEPAKTWPHYA